MSDEKNEEHKVVDIAEVKTNKKKRKARKKKAVEPEDDFKCLTADEMRNTETIEFEEKLAKKDLLLAQANLVLIEKEMETLKYKAALRRSALKELEATSRNREERRKANRKSLAEKYIIEGVWGYHPDTGRIL
jgi:hypothetical protein